MDARTVLLTPEEAIHYELHLRRLSDELRPFGHRENELVQSLAEAQWLLARIPSLEMEIYTVGRIQSAGQSQNCEPREADALIDVRTYFAHQRQLNKLNMEEARLRRQYEKYTKELKQIQQIGRGTARMGKTTLPSSGPKSPYVESCYEFSTADLDILEEHLGLDKNLVPHLEAT
jgi:hypothetical protein